MARELYINAPAVPATLTAGISTSDVTLTPSSLTPFPASGNFTLLIESEKLLCTAVNSGAGTLTVVRAQEGTAAAVHASGVAVKTLLTAGSLARLVIVSKNGTPIAARREFNLVEGTGAALSITDNSGADRVDIGIAFSGSGGGTSGFTTGAANSRPGPTTVPVGQGYLATPGNTFWVSDGTNWLPRGPTFPLMDPPQTGWTTINGGASVALTNEIGFVALQDALAPGGEAVRAAVRAAPTTPYTITAAFLYNFGPGTAGYGGLAFRESATGKLHVFGYRNDNLSLQGGLYTSPTVFSGFSLDSSGNPASALADLSLCRFLRIEDTGTALNFYTSADGINFVKVPPSPYTRNAFFTTAPDQVGFCVNCLTAGAAAQTKLISWAQG